MAAAAPAADAADSREVWKRPCPPDCGARSAALPSGAEAECRDAAGWGGEAELVTRLWVHVNTVGRRSPALPPPNHGSRRVGGGRGPEPTAPTRPSYYGEATNPGPGSGTCAEAAGRRRRLPERAPGLWALPAQPSWWQVLSLRSERKAPRPW